MDDLRQFAVTYYEKGDDQMDNPLEFHCWAEDEDHADEQCENAYPGCSTTHIEEI